jgi:hypothetical protein
MSRKKSQDTLSALYEDEPKRGRPRHKVPRQSVYVALSQAQKQTLSTIAKQLPPAIKRADIPDMAVMTLGARLNQVRDAMAGRDRELPEGITDMESLYFLWDMELPDQSAETTWTSIRLSPNQVVEFGRLQGTFNAMFGANRSHVFTLALALLNQYTATHKLAALNSLDDFERQVAS